MSARNSLLDYEFDTSNKLTSHVLPGAPLSTKVGA
jgi:hypothetical protein